MADEDGSKPKYEVEEISIKTRVQKILDLSTTRSDLLIGLSYCKNRTKTILLPGREYCLQSTKHSFTLHLMYILHSIWQNTFWTQQEKTCYSLYRLETSDDLQVALGRIPQYKIKPEKVFHCSRVLDIFILLFHLFYKKTLLSSLLPASRCCWSCIQWGKKCFIQN